MSNPPLRIHPNELKFPFELKKQVPCSLQFVNTTDNYVAFKVKTTSPKKYCVRPNMGVVLPHNSCDVLVTMQAQREAPLERHCKDKFLVQSVLAPEGTTSRDLSQNLFNKDNGRKVYEIKLRVIYLPPPQPPSPVPESAEEGPSPEFSSFIEYGWNYFGREGVLKERSELRAKLTEAMANETTLKRELSALVLANQRLQQDLAELMNSREARRKMGQSYSHFSFWVVLMVGLFSVLIGYLFIP